MSSAGTVRERDEGEPAEVLAGRGPSRRPRGAEGAARPSDQATCRGQHLAEEVVVDGDDACDDRQRPREEHARHAGARIDETGSSRILTRENEVFSTGTQNVARSPMSAASSMVNTTQSTTAATKNRPS